YAPWLGDAFEPGGDIHAVAQYVVVFDQHVAEVDADAEQHLTIPRHLRVPLRHEPLNDQGALDGRNDGRELQKYAVAGSLDDPAAVARYGWIDGGAVLAENSCRTHLIIAHEPAEASHVSGQDGCQLAFNALGRHRQNLSALRVEPSSSAGIGTWRAYR